MVLWLIGLGRFWLALFCWLKGGGGGGLGSLSGIVFYFTI